MTNKTTIGAIIIGNELLTGKRKDKHQETLIDKLQSRGLNLSWIKIIGDEPNLIRDAIAAHSTDDIVFSFGGIGATPDDLTRAAAAEALNKPLELHPEAKIIIEGRFGKDAYPVRINMGVIPQGSTLIPNVVNQMPGFSVGNTHFLPGFPSMAWPMIDWVLDNYYQSLFTTDLAVEQFVTVANTPESELVTEMQQVMDSHPDISISCLPSSEPDVFDIEFGFRGSHRNVSAARLSFESALQKRGICYTHSHVQ